MPDGLFAYQKSQVWYILDGLGMKDFGINQCHSVCISQFFGIYMVWPFPIHILLSFGDFFQILVYFTKENLAAVPLYLHMYKQTSVHPLEFLLVRVNPFFPLLLRHSIR
jgi:hypothetical protein